MKRIFWSGTIIIIIVLSYFLYSFRYNASFNSDGAVQVLMTFYLDFPHDLYYWGQDRWGSVIPLLSQFFFKVLNISPINSVSLTYYFLLVGGYLGFASLLKTTFSKIIFAIILFLPPLRFVDVLWYPIGIQYSLLGISILILKSIDFSNRKIKNYFLLFASSIIFIFSQWVSDVAFITIFILIALHSLLYWKQSKIKLIIFFYIIFTVVAGYYFIRYGKENALESTDQYLGLNNFSMMIKSIYRIGEAFKGLLLFQVSETLMSIYTYLTIILFIALIFYLIKRKITGGMKSNIWIYFFLFDGIIAIGVALISKWVYLNEANRRYFFGSYISLALAFLLILENLKFLEIERKALKLALSVTIVIGAISTPYYFKYVWLKSLKPQVEIYSELKTLAPAGIIAGYWNAYIAATPDPANIVATPHDQDLIRNPDLVDKVFSHPDIYVIGTDWLNVFPDTLHQFGRVLIKEGKEFTMSDCKICKYRKS